LKTERLTKSEIAFYQEARAAAQKAEQQLQQAQQQMTAAQGAFQQVCKTLMALRNLSEGDQIGENGMITRKDV
jgi:hypothetical protein